MRLSSFWGIQPLSTINRLREVVFDRDTHGVLTGREPYNTFEQVKLSTFIASASMIGLSFLVPVPGQRRGEVIQTVNQTYLREYRCNSGANCMKW